MKKALKSIISIVVLTLLVSACSRKKDSFVSRNFHALNTKYNILFNGDQALEKGRENLNSSYHDNFWELLPVEPLEIRDEIVLGGQDTESDFSKAEEKAVKAIQKHGMNIQGKEKNPQIDEAYLLLGKSRYFDQRFIPALEAFNYILYKYPASSNINQAKIWREKTNIRLENEQLAIKNLKRLLEQDELEGQDLADATSMLAQAYVNTKALDSALTQITVAANTTKRSNERGRYSFIQGQLYTALGKKDSASLAFDNVIKLNRKIPRIYLISAHVEKLKNFDYKNGDKVAFLEHLTELEEDRENRPFLDKIYHQIGEYHLQTNSDSLALAYFNKSLRARGDDTVLAAKNYELSGDIQFNNNNYIIAGAYYDSTLTKLVENSKPFRIIKRKRENLDDVIYYETIAEANDSILALVAMPEADRLAYFEAYTNNLKLEAEAEKEKKAIAAQKKALDSNSPSKASKGFDIGALNSNTKGKKASSFYFYNPTTVAYGKNEFEKIWGSRELKDNWKWSASNASAENELPVNSVLENASEDELFDPQFYLSNIPSKEKVIDSISKERNYAYYQLGLIYKEKFKEYDLSKSKFKNLLNSQPEERLILPSKYHLFKIYELTGDTSEALIAKNDIISQYPDSHYAMILENPEQVIEKDENSPESRYENAFKLFENQEFKTVIANCDKNSAAFEGDAIVPKFELLKAFAIGRLYGFTAYEKAINEVAVNYANTSEGIQAQTILDTALGNLKTTDFVDADRDSNYKVVYQFNAPTQIELNSFREQLDTALENVKRFDLKTSIDVYNETTTFVVVHGFNSKAKASGILELLLEEDRYKITRPAFTIGSKNYKTIQIHKNLDTFLKNQN